VVKLDAGGEQAWSHTWQVSGGSVEVGVQPSIAVASNGDVIVASMDVEHQVGAFVKRLRADDGGELWSLEVENSVRAVAARGDAIYAYGIAPHGTPPSGHAWLRKLDDQGEELWTRVWGDGSTNFGAQSPAGGPQPASDLCVLEDGGAVVAGSFVSLGLEVDFDPGDGTALLPVHRGADAFVTAFAPDGEHRWVLGWGGDWNDGASSVAEGDDGSIFVAGWLDRAASMPDRERIEGAGLEALVVAITADGSYLGTRAFGGPEEDLAYGVGVLQDGTLALAGSFSRGVDFALADEVDLRQSAGFTDAFLTRFRFRPERRMLAPDPPTRPQCKFTADALPTDYEECVAAGGEAYLGFDGETCLISWCEPSSEFDECKARGGGMVVGDTMPPQYCCKIVYPEAGCPCLGNACD
jgi:hypothetical protein